MSKIVCGTTYHDETPEQVIAELEIARDRHTRLRLYLGDTETGRDWDERFDVEGYIGRSNGQIKIPLLIKNSRSTGGGAILDHCIVKIATAKGKRVLWQHPKYHQIAG